MGSSSLGRLGGCFPSDLLPPAPVPLAATLVYAATAAASAFVAVCPLVALPCRGFAGLVRDYAGSAFGSPIVPAPAVL